MELRRKLILTFIDSHYHTVKVLEEEIARLKKDASRETWTALKLLDRVSPEFGIKIITDRQVNDMDPDFSFDKALEEMEKE